MRRLAQEVGNDPLDLTQMTNQQIREFNQDRKAYNLCLTEMGCYELPMLPEHEVV